MMKYVSDLELELMVEVVVVHSQRLLEEGYDQESIVEHCKAIVDCKVVDIEDSIEPELFDKVMKAAGLR